MKPMIMFRPFAFALPTRWIALLAFGLLSALPLAAQRIAIVDVTKMLESIEEYQEAQEELDRIAAQWRQEIAQDYDRIKSLYNSYQAEQVLLSDEDRRAREDEIMALETQVRDKQKDYFGPEGQLFERRKDLVQPIQDRVYGAIEAFANDRGYDLVLDKSSSAGLIFNNPEYDKTEDVLNRL